MFDIVRERASVYWAELPELGSNCVVFATTQEIINTGVEALGLPKRVEIPLLPESNYYRYNALSGLHIVDFQLSESTLNKVITYPTYSGGRDYKTDYTEAYKFSEFQTKASRDAEIEEIYEGYARDKKYSYESKKFKEEIQGVSDDLVVEGFFDTEEPLIDRLYAYDALMATSYGDTYEDLPTNVRLFIERKEEEDYIIFSDILEMIEVYQTTDNVQGIFQIFAKRKRA